MIYDALNSLAAWLCQTIYPLIAYVYKLFYNIGTLRIIENEDIQPIYNRFTLILGLVMLFFMIFQLIQYIMEPDNFGDKEKGFGKVMYRMVISVVLIAMVPTLFDFAFKIQEDIISNNLIPKILLGTEENYQENFGANLSAMILKNFYKGNPKSDIEHTKCEIGSTIENVVKLNLSDLNENGRLGSTLDICLDEVDKNTGEKKIIFDGILAILSGGVILWMLIMYCLDLGVRVVQLTYLQIIAPIPILMYIVPKKDGAFEKWVKQCLTTFLDLYLRTAIICFAVLIISTLNTNFEAKIVKQVSESGQGDVMFTSLLYICLVLGVMTFAKKAGDMLKELFPKGNAASGELGLSTKNRIPEPAKRVAGAGVGLVAAGTVGLGRRIVGNIKYGKTGKEEKANIKNRLNNALTSYREADDAVKRAREGSTEYKAAIQRRDAYKKEVSNARNELKAANWRYSKARMAAGTVLGTVSAANKGAVAGLTTKGGMGGVAKATKSVLKSNQAHDEWRENSNGELAIKRVVSSVGQTIGISPMEKYEKRKERIEKENTALTKYSENFKKAKEAIETDIEEGKCDNVSPKARAYRLKQVEAERLTAQAGNLKLTDFRYKDATEKNNAKSQIERILTTPQQKVTEAEFNNLESSRRVEYRKNDKLLKIAEQMWNEDRENNKNGTKFSALEGDERTEAISKMLDKLADSAYEEVNYEATQEEYEARALDAKNAATALKKEATQEISDTIMNGGFKDETTGDVIYKNDKAEQLFAVAKNAATDGNNDTEIFKNADLVTFANLKELNDRASAQQNENAIDLYRMQQSPEYKAAEANKKYHENGQK